MIPAPFESVDRAIEKLDNVAGFTVRIQEQNCLGTGLEGMAMRVLRTLRQQPQRGQRSLCTLVTDLDQMPYLIAKSFSELGWAEVRPLRKERRTLFVGLELD